MARVVFLGTPEFAVASLQAVANHAGFTVVGVVTQPDRPAGRGREPAMPAVKKAAQALGLPVFQPETLRDPAAVDHLRRWQPDVLVVAAFGQILRQAVLDLAPFGGVNVHASLLPRGRGAAPIAYAILEGDSETGITIMKMDSGLDTGPILSQHPVAITADETAATLHNRLAELGAAVLPGTLLGYLAGTLIPRPQPSEGVTLAPTLRKDQGAIDWSHSAVRIDRQVRAYTPWPGAFTHLHGAILKVNAGYPLPDIEEPLPPGTLTVYRGDLAVVTGCGLYVPGIVQPAGKKPMTGQAFLAGHPGSRGMVLGAS